MTQHQDVSATGLRSGEVVDWSELGREMWSFLTGRRAAINYQFVDMAVEIPRDTGAQAPRATWKIDGILRISTDDDSTRASGVGPTQPPAGSAS